MTKKDKYLCSTLLHFCVSFWFFKNEIQIKLMSLFYLLINIFALIYLKSFKFIYHILKGISIPLKNLENKKLVNFELFCIFIFCREFEIFWSTESGNGNIIYIYIFNFT